MRGGRSLDRLLDQGGRGAEEPGDDLAGCRIDHIKRLARLVFDEAAIDEMRCLGLCAHGVLLEVCSFVSVLGAACSLDKLIVREEDLIAI